MRDINDCNGSGNSGTIPKLWQSCSDELRAMTRFWNVAACTISHAGLYITVTVSDSRLSEGRGRKTCVKLCKVPG